MEGSTLDFVDKFDRPHQIFESILSIASLNQDASLQYLSICALSLCTMDACSGHPLCLPLQVRRVKYSMHEGVPHDEDSDCNIDLRGAVHLACACPISVWCLAVA